METLKTLFTRQSTRSFAASQISDKALETLLKAACAAPVGMAKFDEMHLTVVQNAALLDKITACAANFSGRPDMKPFYGAPTVIIVSVVPHEAQQAHIPYANAGCMVENMALAATDLDLGSVYLWGFLAALNQNPALVKELQLPEGFVPVSAVAVGYPTAALAEKEIALDKVATNYIK